MKIYVVNTSKEFFWFYATKKEAMKKIKQLQKKADIENAEYKKLIESRDEDDVITTTGDNETVWVGDYDHIDYNTYEFEPNKKGLIHAMQDGLGLVSFDSVGDTNE